MVLRDGEEVADAAAGQLTAQRRVVAMDLVGELLGPGSMLRRAP
jgi:hypothetical protein